MKMISALQVIAAVTLAAGFCYGQGALAPAGAPAPTMKTLQEMEPRGMIKSVPVTINQSGSYYFTGDLTCTSPNNAIDVQAANVTIDMRGFRLSSALGMTSGSGISCQFPNLKVFNGNIAIFQGTDSVDGTSAAGVHCTGDQAVIERVNAEGNNIGILVRRDSLVENCTVTGNIGSGISAGVNSIVKSCRADFNQNDGIVASCASVIDKCTARGNQSNGIHITANLDNPNCCAVISKCTASDNNQDGILAESGANIYDCAANGNGFLEPMGNANGIHITAAAVTVPYSAGSVVRNCTANNNKGHGISVVSDNEIVENTACGNGQGFNMGGTWAGIAVFGDNNRIFGNVTSSNLGDLFPPPWSIVGIYIEGYKNRIEANHSSGNRTWAYQVVLSDNIIIKNTAYGTPQTSDYSIVAGNQVARIITPTVTAGAIPPNSNSGLLGAVPAAGLTLPWANFDD